MFGGGGISSVELGLTGAVCGAWVSPVRGTLPQAVFTSTNISELVRPDLARPALRPPRLTASGCRNAARKALFHGPGPFRVARVTPTRQGSYRLFRLAGIDVFLHWSWFLVAAYEVTDRAGRYTSLTWNVLEYVSLFGIDLEQRTLPLLIISFLSFVLPLVLSLPLFLFIY